MAVRSDAELLPLREAARHLGVSPQALRARIHARSDKALLEHLVTVECGAKRKRYYVSVDYVKERLGDISERADALRENIIKVYYDIYLTIETGHLPPTMRPEENDMFRNMPLINKIVASYLIDYAKADYEKRGVVYTPSVSASIRFIIGENRISSLATAKLVLEGLEAMYEEMVKGTLDYEWYIYREVLAYRRKNE